MILGGLAFRRLLPLPDADASAGWSSVGARAAGSASGAGVSADAAGPRSWPVTLACSSSLPASGMLRSSLARLEVAADLLLGEMGELEIAARGEMHAVIGAKPAYQARHVGTHRGVAAGLIGEPAPRIDELGAVDEGLLAIDVVQLLGIVAVVGAAHDRQTGPIDGKALGAEFLDEGFHPLAVEVVPGIGARLHDVLALT